MIIKVTNLSTGEDRLVDRETPAAAVVQAWKDDAESGKPTLISNLRYGKKTVSMGDWCSLNLQTGGRRG
jgi:hypothetical protein